MPVARLLPAWATRAELLRTSATMAERLPTMRSSRRVRSASSSLPRTVNTVRRLPDAVCSMLASTSRKSLMKLT